MTVTTPDRPAREPDGHAGFGASVDVPTATVHLRGALDLFAVDLLQGAIDVLTTSGCTDITLDLADVNSIDHAAAWCIAETSAAPTSRHARLTIGYTRAAVEAALGDLQPARDNSPEQNRHE